MQPFHPCCSMLKFHQLKVVVDSRGKYEIADTVIKQASCVGGAAQMHNYFMLLNLTGLFKWL